MKIEPMNIELTTRQFRYLLDLVYIGNWVLNSTRGDDRIQEYDKVEGHIFAHCLNRPELRDLLEIYQGQFIPSRAFANGGIHEAIECYEDTIFYEILAEEMALRDLSEKPVAGEYYDALMDRIDVYMSEFSQHGTDHISVDLDE